MSATTARAPRPSKSAIDATQAPEPSVEAVVDPIESDATGEVVAPFYRNIAAEAEQGERLAFEATTAPVMTALSGGRFFPASNYTGKPGQRLSVWRTLQRCNVCRDQ